MKRFFIEQAQIWNSLRKNNRVFTLTVVSTMGIALGALLCVITLGYLLILKPLSYPDQDQLYQVKHFLIDKAGESNVDGHSYPGLIRLYKKQTVFSKTALVHFAKGVLTSTDSQPTMATAYVTPEWFTLLGAPVELGRTFTQSEALDKYNPVAILSYDSWQNDFSGDKNILDKKIVFNDVSFRIVGVLAKSFVEPKIYRVGVNTKIWMPWDYNLTSQKMRESWAYVSDPNVFVGKLDEQYTSSQADQLITPIVDETWKEEVTEYEFFDGWNVKLKLSSFKSVIMGESQSTIIMLILGVIGLVVIACANISNLFMSRTAKLQRPLAVRAALGATKEHLFKTLFAESLLLMFLSVIVGLIIAAAGIYILQQNLAGVLPRIDELSINSVTIGGGILSVIGFAYIFAKLSCQTINYRALNTTLQSSGKGTGIQVSSRVRQVLIGSQVAIATLLIFVNINLFTNAVNKIEEPMDFKVDNVHSLVFSYAGAEWPGHEAEPILNEIHSRLLQLPQVDSISRSGSPLDPFSLWALSEESTNLHFTAEGKAVSENHFQMLEQPLLEGDYLFESDIKFAYDVVVINDVLARRLAPTGSALGMKILNGTHHKLEVIGVVKGIKIPGQKEVPIRIYSPNPRTGKHMLIKLKDGQSLTRTQIIKELKEVSKQFTIYRFESLAVKRVKLLFSQIITAITTAVLALLSFYLAAIGLYGIINYSTQIRRFELGIRIAIGARPKDLLTLVVKDSSGPVVFGIVISILIMLLGYLAYAGELADYISWQLLPLIFVTLFSICLISFSACYLPLRQFVNNPAIHSLRGEK